MSESKPSKTPMFEALNASRYHRQELFRRIYEASGVPLIAYIGGPEALIDRGDTVYFADLLHNVLPHGPLDFMLHTGGGDIDAAEKLMSILRARIGVGELRVIVPDKERRHINGHWRRRNRDE